MVDITFEKVLALGRTKLEPRTDIFNLLNSSAATNRIAQLGPTYQFPTEILGGRLMKVGANLTW